MMNNSNKPESALLTSKSQQQAEVILTKLCDNLKPEDLRDLLLLMKTNAAYGVMQDSESKYKKIALINRFLDFTVDLLLWQEEIRFCNFLTDAIAERQVENKVIEEWSLLDS